MNYFIFKTDKNTGKTVNICGGAHDDELQCRMHWQAYMYGFMDGAFELLGRKNFEMMNGERMLSFQIIIPGKKQVEYFMLLDKEGQDLIQEICKEEKV